MPDDEVLTAIAWSMQKDPYRSAGGRYMRARVFRVMLIDTFVITDFHTYGRLARITVTKYASARMAQHRAIRETQRREQEGFALTIGPHSKQTKAGIRPQLEEKRDFKGHDGNLESSIEHCLIYGTPLAVSPTESPAA